jgi:thiamine-phosphate diphosphorylase
VNSGFDAVMLRAPGCNSEQQRAVLQVLTAQLGPAVSVIVHGDPELARAMACGLHLPAAAAPCNDPPRPFGRSVHDQAQLSAALAQAPDYVLFGNVFETATHPGRAARGVDALREIVRAASPTPVLAIGGITAPRIAELREAGAAGCAVMRAVLGAPDPASAARALVEAWQGAQPVRGDRAER